MKLNFVAGGQLLNKSDLGRDSSEKKEKKIAKTEEEIKMSIGI